MARRAAYPLFKAFDISTSDFLNGGLLYTYVPGTTTNKETYTDAAGSVAHTNPIVLDSYGESEIFLSGTTKFVLTDSAGSPIWSKDYVEEGSFADAQDVTALLGNTGTADGETINVLSYNAPNYASISPFDGGGGSLVWDSTQDKANADFGTIFDPSVSLANQGTGTGLGCWMRNIRDSVSVAMFGAGGTAFNADDGLALSRAFSYASTNSLKLTARAATYGYSQKFADITDIMTFEGSGSESCIFKPISTYSGYGMTITDCWRNGNGEDQSTATTETTAGKMGVTLSGFSIIGDRAHTAAGISFIDRNDKVMMLDVKVKYCTGTGLYIGDSSASNLGLMRESRFYNVAIHGCGDATNEGMKITTGTAVLDGTNQLEFHDLAIIYPFGIGLHITHEDSGAPDDTRRCDFFGMMLHGQNQAAVSAPPFDLLKITGNTNDINFYGLKTNGSNDDTVTKYSCIFVGNRTTGVDTSFPSRLSFKGVNLRNSKGNGIRLERVDRITFDGYTLGSGPGQAILGSELVVDATALNASQMIYDIVGKSSLTRDFDIDANQFDEIYTTITYDQNAPFAFRMSEASFDSGKLSFGTGAGQKPAFYHDTVSDPNGSITADKRSLYVQKDTDLNKSVSGLWVKTKGIDNADWNRVIYFVSETSGSLLNAAAAINANKWEGMPVWDSTLKQQLWAGGALTTDVWVDGVGATVHTPV